MDREKEFALSIKDYTKFWLVRELHPPEQDDGAVYVCLECPSKGYYNNGKNWFWKTTDPSKKIRLSAGVAFCLGICPGVMHIILREVKSIE